MIQSSSEIQLITKVIDTIFRDGAHWLSSICQISHGFKHNTS